MSEEIRPIWANPGDVFFTQGSGLLARLIKWAESDPNETNGTWANHAGVVITAGWMVPPASMRDEIPAWPCTAKVVEALGRTTNGSWWERNRKAVLEGKYAVRVFRPIPPLSPDALATFQSEALKQVGTKYGWWKLFAHLADRLVFRGTKVFSVLLFAKGRPICSFLAALLYEKARPIGTHVRIPNTNEVRITGWMFGMPPQSADPDEMMDYCIAHPDEWEEV